LNTPPTESPSSGSSFFPLPPYISMATCAYIGDDTRFKVYPKLIPQRG
jgi:hypothetical protein